MRRAVAILFALAASMAAPAAHADAIDGEWCSAQGKNLSIEGPKIRTPAGIEATGQYDRHGFAYEPPPGDPEHGMMIIMRIYSDNDMELARIRDGKAGPVELWHRCNVTS